MLDPHLFRSDCMCSVCLGLRRPVGGPLSLTPSPHSETPRNTPNPSPSNAPRSEKFETDMDELLNHIGTQLLECWRTVQMVRGSRITGVVATPDTPIRKPRDAFSAAASLARQPAPSSNPSTPKAAKVAPSGEPSPVPFSSDEQTEYLLWIKRTRRKDNRVNRLRWMSHWRSKTYQSYRATFVGRVDPSRS